MSAARINQALRFLQSWQGQIASLVGKYEVDGYARTLDALAVITAAAEKMLGKEDPGKEHLRAILAGENPTPVRDLRDTIERVRKWMLSAARYEGSGDIGRMEIDQVLFAAECWAKYDRPAPVVDDPKLREAIKQMRHTREVPGLPAHRQNATPEAEAMSDEATETAKTAVLAELAQTITAVEVLLAANDGCKNVTGPVLLPRSAVNVLVSAAIGFRDIINQTRGQP